MPNRATLSCLLVLAAVASGCGSGSSSSATTSTTSAPASAGSRAAGATGAASSPGAANSAAGLDGVPAYQPSRTIKRSSHYLVLFSPDSEAKVRSAYPSMFAGGGWAIVAREMIPNGEIFTARRGTTVASVEVGAKGSGASIVIGTYSAG